MSTTPIGARGRAESIVKPRGVDWLIRVMTCVSDLVHVQMHVLFATLRLTSTDGVDVEKRD